MAFKSGFFSITGCPNVGKSTLINRVVGQKIAAVTSKPQTTRGRIMGVLNRPNSQMVFLDTPGIVGAKNRLEEYMQKTAGSTLSEVEAVLFILDPARGMRERDDAIIELLKASSAPVLAVINKTDIISAYESEQAKEYLNNAGIFREIFSISALNGDGVDDLINGLEKYTVEGPKYFPDDMVTDQPERVLCAELVREKALILLKQEIPHGIGVNVDEMRERDEGDIIDISVTILCDKDSHKGIIIGRGGSMLKSIGEKARHDMEWMLGKKVFLQLYVKVQRDWRNSLAVLRELGYE